MSDSTRPLSPVSLEVDSGDNPNASKLNAILAPEELSRFNQRSNVPGILQLVGHLAIMAGSGYLWATHLEQWLLALPALVIYGFSFASMFATMHECVHRTAFANNRLNDGVAWFAGLLSLYNSTFYRRYHKWHHRYTQIPGKDPELSDPKPTNVKEYLLEISGLPWWIGKVRGHVRIALGQVVDYPFLPEASHGEVIRSTRLQLLVYVGAIALSVMFHQPWIWLYWLLPLAVGQPILRIILLSEHTGCTNDDNYLTNTRTTYTFWLIRFLMWNMPFHAEHHLYASIPFHALPAAHEKLRDRFTHIAPHYFDVQRQLIGNFSPKAGQPVL